jgi:hypothetical protein
MLDIFHLLKYGHLVHEISRVKSTPASSDRLIIELTIFFFGNSGSELNSNVCEY